MNFGHCKIVVPTKPTALVSDLIKNVSSKNTRLELTRQNCPGKMKLIHLFHLIHLFQDSSGPDQFKRVNKTRILENNLQAEKRYKVMEKSKIKILTVKNKNGALLFPEDRILEVIDDNEFLTADFSDSD